MLRIVADENFHGPVLRALRLRCPAMDVVRVVDAGLSGISDPALLAWAAENGRVVLTHDVETLAGFAHARVRAGEPMSGVIEVRLGGAMRRIVDDVLLIVELAHEDEIEGKVIFVPFIE